MLKQALLHRCSSVLWFNCYFPEKHFHIIFLQTIPKISAKETAKWHQPPANQNFQSSASQQLGHEKHLAVSSVCGFTYPNSLKCGK